jgi:urease accessory protein UreE
LLENSERQRNRRKGKSDTGEDFAPDLEAPENNEDDGIEGDADEL